MQVRRHHVFQQYCIACTRRRQREPSAQRTGSDNGDLQFAIYFAARALADVRSIRLRLFQMDSDPGPLFGRQRGNKRKNPAQGHRNVIDVIHQANGFSRERHWRSSS